MRIKLKDTKATQELGRTLGSLLNPGDILILSGELGAGKTTLAQGLAEGLGVTGRVTSPTFTLVQEHQGRYPFYHIDVYRLDNLEEIWDLGFDEYFYGQGVTVVEWGERLGRLLPSEYLSVSLEYDLDSRQAILRAKGKRYEHILKELKKLVGSGG
ncbi:MAG: tRNA threonylcarbamoyladenosine biosynthesis protein TsaE [Clostridia bacterium]|nr:tRNA threonylcarbamoyladenosine biosynthesis protein TsaE [Clostridia bacterium]